MTAFQCMRSGGRVVEGARLESEYTPKAYRGFESLPLRHWLPAQSLKNQLRRFLALPYVSAKE
jgi:hypothetical protein